MPAKMGPFSGGVCAPGCLTAEPPAPKRQYNRTHQLAELIAAAQAIEDGKPVPVHLLVHTVIGTWPCARASASNKSTRPGAH